MAHMHTSILILVLVAFNVLLPCSAGSYGKYLSKHKDEFGYGSKGGATTTKKITTTTGIDRDIKSHGDNESNGADGSKGDNGDNEVIVCNRDDESSDCHGEKGNDIHG